MLFFLFVPLCGGVFWLCQKRFPMFIYMIQEMSRQQYPALGRNYTPLIERNLNSVVGIERANPMEVQFLPTIVLQDRVDSRHPIVAGEIAEIKQLLRDPALRESNELAADNREKLLEELDALRRSPSEELMGLSAEIKDSITRSEGVRTFFLKPPTNVHDE